MVPIASLWLPILVSAVIVFVVSSIIHMALPIHRGDMQKVPREDEVMAALRDAELAPGDYVIPYAGSMEAMNSAEYKARRQKGPVVVMTVMPSGPGNMGASLAQWFAFSVVVSLLCAYVAGRALGPGAHYLGVFRFVGVTAFIGYGLALAHDSIWWKKKWSTTLKYMFDGLVYALMTAGTFGWLWPK